MTLAHIGPYSLHVQDAQLSVLADITRQCLGRDPLPEDAESFTLRTRDFTKLSVYHKGNYVGSVVTDYKNTCITITFEPKP